MNALALGHSTYEFLRHLADSWGLLGMALVFLVLAFWPFRPGARAHNQRASTMIFDANENEGCDNG